MCGESRTHGVDRGKSWRYLPNAYLSVSLMLAADSAREGDFTKTAQYVENIAEVFFPLDGGEDPVWPNAQLTFLS